MVSGATLKLIFKKLPFGEFGCNVKEQYLQFLESENQSSSFQPSHTFVRVWMPFMDFSETTCHKCVSEESDMNVPLVFFL